MNQDLDIVRTITISVSSGMFLILGLIFMFLNASKEAKRKNKTEKRLKQFYTKCLELILTNKIDEAKEIYNTTFRFFPKDNRSHYLKGLILGSNLDKYAEEIKNKINK